MSNPEFVAQKCDQCPHKIGPRGTLVVYDPPKMFENHSDAHREARAYGWYIAEKDLCPYCASKMEVPGE